jgi:uncharacterized protein (TIGR00251 family)
VSNGLLRHTREGTILNVRVSPGAKRTSIEGRYGEAALRLRVAAPPVDGKANAELKRFLSELLGVPRSDVTVLRGAGSRDKAVLIQTSQHHEIRETLSRYLD